MGVEEAKIHHISNCDLAQHEERVLGRSGINTLFNIRANRSQLDKLVISQLGFLAQRRLARGVRLNHAEATVWL